MAPAPGHLLLQPAARVRLVNEQLAHHRHERPEELLRERSYTRVVMQVTGERGGAAGQRRTTLPPECQDQGQGLGSGWGPGSVSPARPPCLPCRAARESWGRSHRLLRARSAV